MKREIPEYTNSQISELIDEHIHNEKYRKILKRRLKEIKKKFQMRDATKEQVIYAMNILCKEITEFIQTLYSSTDMEEERTLIKHTIEDLKAL